MTTHKDSYTQALKYLHDSTAPDGQWEDQAVHAFVGEMIKSDLGPNGDDTKRLEWLFSRLNDSEIKRKVQAVGDVHAGGSMHGIRMTDWRHALDVTMQQYIDTPSATHARDGV